MYSVDEGKQLHLNFGMVNVVNFDAMAQRGLKLHIFMQFARMGSRVVQAERCESFVPTWIIPLILLLSLPLLYIMAWAGVGGGGGVCGGWGEGRRRLVHAPTLQLAGAD